MLGLVAIVAGQMLLAATAGVIGFRIGYRQGVRDVEVRSFSALADGAFGGEQ